MSLLQDPDSGIGANVKQASTAPVAADSALVVSISPNSSPLSIPPGAATAANQTNGTQVTSVNNFPATQPVSIAATVPISATSLPLPTGAASSANQTNGNQQTQIVEGGNIAAVTASSALKVDGSAVTQPISIAATVAISAASLPLPTGAATSANLTTLGTQTTELNDGTRTATIKAASTAPAVGDTALVVAVSPNTPTLPVSAVSLPLPTGAATAANQTNGTQQTEINNGANIAAVKAASTAAVAADPALVVAVSPNNSIAAAQFGTWTVQPGNTANTTPWLSTLNQGGNSAAVTGSNALKVDGSAVTQPISAASLPLPTGAATSANLTTLGSQTTELNDGTRTATIKAASTASVAADTALVIALSPNSSIPTGSNTIGALTANQSINTAQVGGTTVVTGGLAGSLGVGGLAAGGASITGNPVLVAGSDGTLAQTLRVNPVNNGIENLLAQNGENLRQTYSASVNALVAVSGATDIFTLTGSSTKTVRVTHIIFTMTTTTAVMVPVMLVKRSTADSGGTSAAISITPHDSNNSAATAVATSYTANPAALGTIVGTAIRSIKYFSEVATTPTGAIQVLDFTFGNDNDQPVVLRGTTQQFTINLNGTTIAGASVNASMVWTEDNT